VGGLYWKRASTTGAILALLASFTNVIGLVPVQSAMGRLMGNPELSLRPERAWLITFGLTIATTVLGSLLFPDKPQTKEDA